MESSSSVPHPHSQTVGTFLEGIWATNKMFNICLVFDSEFPLLERNPKEMIGLVPTEVDREVFLSIGLLLVRTANSYQPFTRCQELF